MEDISLALPLRATDKVRCPESLVNRLRTLATSMTDAQIADTLNQEGSQSPKGKCFTRSIVNWLRYRYHIPAPNLKRPDEMTVEAAAEHFGVSPGVIYYWIERGHLPARRLELGKPYWITLEPKTETALRAWVANSKRIKPQPSQQPLAACAI